MTRMMTTIEIATERIATERIATMLLCYYITTTKRIALTESIATAKRII